MLFKIINSESLKSKRTTLTYLLIISCLITFSSCMTTESLTVTPDNLKSGYADQISNIILKNGDSIDCKNKNVEIIKRSDSVTVLSIFSRVTRENFGSFRNEKIILLNEILNIKLDKTEIDRPMTILLFAGLLSVAVGLIMLGTFSFKMK